MDDATVEFTASVRLTAKELREWKPSRIDELWGDAARVVDAANKAAAETPGQGR